MLESRWWEPDAQHKIITSTDTGDVELILLHIPFIDENCLVTKLMARSDLDVLFALYYRQYVPLHGQRADISLLTDGSKA